jgi:hypothetical protein
MHYYEQSIYINESDHTLTLLWLKVISTKGHDKCQLLQDIVTVVATLF